MRNFDYWIVYGLVSNNLIWIRLRWAGWGIAIKRTPKLFSERYGYVKSIPLFCGWRIGILKAKSYDGSQTKTVGRN